MSVTESTYPFAAGGDVFELPHELAWLRANEPVANIKVATGDDVWLVTRYEHVRQVLADRRFSRNIFREDAARLIPGVPTRQVSSPFVEAPGHTRWRRLMGKAFTPRQVQRLEGPMREVVDRLIGEIMIEGPPADLMAAFAYPLSITVMCELLGIDVDQHEPFRELADAALTVNDLSPEEKGAAFQGMDRFSRDLIAAKREEGGEDLLAQLVAVHDADDGSLTEDELVATILAMLVGGYESAVMQIGKSLQVLLRNPDQLEALRADPDRIGEVIEETLRYASLDSGFGSPRYALEEVEVGGVTIPKGSTVLVLRASGNRDESVFSDAERFDIDREGQHHFAFGHGPHVCLGAAVARMELKVGVGAIVKALPAMRLAVADDEVPWEYRITAAGPQSLPVTW